MNLASVDAASPPPRAALHRLGRPRQDWRAPSPPANRGTPREQAHAALVEALRPSGGLARADDLARLLEYLELWDFISLARHIAARRVFGFSVGAQLWIPMFQFDLRDLSVRRGATAVLAEFDPAVDGWALACWFARPHPGLDGRRPVELMPGGYRAVCEAARAMGPALPP